MSSGLEQGFLQVYTGSGKGKTTAALGLTLRAAGAGLRVFLAQFAKGTPTSELAALERFADLVTVRQYGGGRFIRGGPAPEDIAAARTGLEEVRRVMASGGCDVMILDEACVAADLGLITQEELLELAAARPPRMEMVITGRRAEARLLERADLVTEMREVRHYYAAGVVARTGIEK